MHLVAIQVQAIQFLIVLWPLWKQINLKRHLVAIQVKAFQFSVLLWPLWKQINLVEYFEKTLGRHSGESLSIFHSFVTFVEKFIWQSILKRHLVAIQVKAFQFSVLLWPLWKQINLIEYFEKTLSRHLGESLPIFNSFVTFVEINKFDQVFWKDTWSPFRWKISNFHFFCDLCGNK